MLASLRGCAASASLGKKYFVQRELGHMVGIGVDYVDRRVLAKYNLNKKIGRGLYGIVWKAHAKSDNRERAVAIKRLFNAFSNSIDAKRTYREVSYLLSFCNHPNIVSVHEVIGSSEDMDLYLVMEHIDVDLSSVIPSMCEFSPLNCYPSESTTDSRRVHHMAASMCSQVYSLGISGSSRHQAAKHSCECSMWNQTL